MKRQLILVQPGSQTPKLPRLPRVLHFWFPHARTGISDHMEGKAGQRDRAEGNSAEAADKDSGGFSQGQNPPRGCREGAGANPTSLPISPCLKRARKCPLFQTALNSPPRTRRSRENSETTHRRTAPECSRTSNSAAGAHLAAAGWRQGWS